MTDLTPAPTTSVHPGWVVHVEVELRRTRDAADRADGLALALVSRPGHDDAAVTIRRDVVHVTWRRSRSDAITDAGQALAHSLDETLRMLTPRVAVKRVRRAWTEVAASSARPRRRSPSDLPRQQRPVQPD